MKLNNNYDIENFNVEKYDSNIINEITINTQACDYNKDLQDEIGIPLVFAHELAHNAYHHIDDTLWY